MIKEQLYLFLPYTGSNMSIYTNNKQIYTITQHSSSKNICTVYINKTYQFEHMGAIHEQHGLNITIKKHEKLYEILHCFW